MATKTWISDDGRLTMGKYKDSKIETVARDSPEYLQWIMDLEDTSREDKRVLAASLNYIR